MTISPPSSIPWQITGNHWISLPCIHPADGSIHALGVVSRTARGAVEITGSRDFLEGAAAPFARLGVRAGDSEVRIGANGLVWERALGWLPTFTSTDTSLSIRGTMFAPCGRDSDFAGVVYAVTVENRGVESQSVTVALGGTFGHRQQRVRTPRAFADAHLLTSPEPNVILMEGSSLPGYVSLALCGEGDTAATIGSAAEGEWSLARELQIEPGESVATAFFIAAGPEADGALATLRVLARRGWQSLLGATEEALRHLQQSTGSDSVDRLLNRNLMFAYFCAVARAVDDAQFYLVRSRIPWNGRGLTVRDWEALTWTIAAVQLADAPLARELILRMCELHGYSPGKAVHYLDGMVFEPGFSLEGAASYAVAIDRYIRQTGDDAIVEDPVLADTLYTSHEDIEARRDSRQPLYATELTPGGEPATLPLTLHGNAVVAYAMEVFKHTLDEKTADKVQEAGAIRAAIRRHFVLPGKGGAPLLGAATDLDGHMTATDDPAGSAFWLPMYDAIERDDSLYLETVRHAGGEGHLVAHCARLIGPESSATLEWFRRAPLDGGFAAEQVDASGRVTGNGGDAALSGLVAATVWYAVQVLGTRLAPN